jgi:DNA replication protein DnaC
MTDSPEKGGLNLPPTDPGYFYDPRVEAGQHGQIRLSPRVEEHCRCEGRPPYMVFDSAESEPVWCACRPYRTRVRRINRFISESGIPERFRYKFLDDFHESARNRPIPGAGHLKELLRPLIYRCAEARSRTSVVSSSDPAAISAGPPPKGFLLWGKPGNGKTLFSCIALNELIFHTARAGRFIGLSRKFFQTLRHTFDEDSPTHGQALPIVEQLSSVPFLVIDDFGVQRDTEWEVEMLYNLIDARYAEQRLTIVTTNRNVEKVKDLADGRIYSRFLEMCHIIHVQAPDYREHSKREYAV